MLLNPYLQYSDHYHYPLSSYNLVLEALNIFLYHYKIPLTNILYHPIYLLLKFYYISQIHFYSIYHQLLKLPHLLYLVGILLFLQLSHHILLLYPYHLLTYLFSHHLNYHILYNLPLVYYILSSPFYYISLNLPVSHFLLLGQMLLYYSFLINLLYHLPKVLLVLQKLNLSFVSYKIVIFLNGLLF